MEIVILNPVKWELFWMGSQIRKEVYRNCLPEIQKDPENKVREIEFERVKMYSYHFSIGKAGYRIIYKMHNDKIYIIMVEFRRNFSKENQAFFKKLNSRLVALSKIYE
ncbi:MAG: hypothetical protein ABIH00_03240 [Armatimonadota bacterium]